VGSKSHEHGHYDLLMPGLVARACRAAVESASARRGGNQRTGAGRRPAFRRSAAEVSTISRTTARWKRGAAGMRA